MIIEKTEFEGLYLVSIEKNSDYRGFFARSFCKKEFESAGIVFDCKQCNVSYNKKKYTLRGMHYQKKPYLEDKIVTCIKGRVFDVVVDCRTESKTYLKWKGIELTPMSFQSVYIPKGFAHGFMTLEDDSVLYYQMSEYYYKGYEAGIRYNDPLIGINWPTTEGLIISERDNSFPYIEKNFLK